MSHFLQIALLIVIITPFSSSIECSDNCLTCEEYDSDTCTSCYWGNGLINNKCYTSYCPDLDHCGYCQDNINCVQCFSSEYILKNGWCKWEKKAPLFFLILSILLIIIVAAALIFNYFRQRKLRWNKAAGSKSVESNKVEVPIELSSNNSNIQTKNQVSNNEKRFNDISGYNQFSDNATNMGHTPHASQWMDNSTNINNITNVHGLDSLVESQRKWEESNRKHGYCVFCESEKVFMITNCGCYTCYEHTNKIKKYDWGIRGEAVECPKHDVKITEVKEDRYLIKVHNWVNDGTCEICHSGQGSWSFNNCKCSAKVCAQCYEDNMTWYQYQRCPFCRMSVN